MKEKVHALAGPFLPPENLWTWVLWCIYGPTQACSLSRPRAVHVQGPNPAFAVGECWAYHTAIKYAQPEEKIIALGAFWSGVVSMSVPGLLA